MPDRFDFLVMWKKPYFCTSWRAMSVVAGGRAEDCPPVAGPDVVAGPHLLFLCSACVWPLALAMAGFFFWGGGGFSLSEKEKEEEKKECVLEGVLSGVGQTDTEPAFEWRSGEVSCGGMAEKKTLLSCLSDTTPSAIACHHIYILFRMARYGGCKLVGSTQCSNQNVGA
jgi:hypothetical protein